MPGIDRRRFLTVSAAMAGAALLSPRMLHAAPQAAVWRGQAMGAPVMLILNHPDPARAQVLLRETAAELRRLEAIFTLYRAASELSRLNRDGYLLAPSPEMLGALQLAADAHAATGGRFDPTVQPLWRLYARHFQSGGGPEGPALAAIAEARAHGDLKENAEYHAAREKQSFIEGRVKELEAIISLAEVIDVAKLSGAIKFGATVTLVDEESDEEKTYQIVGETEADIESGKLNVRSPLARALIGKDEGDSVEVRTPGGQRSYEVVSIRYL